MAFTFECFLTFLITFCIIVSNILILCVVFKTDRLDYINKYFFVSMTICDLGIGVFITSFSFWAAIFDGWIYGRKFCNFEAYLATIFWIASIYSLTWISIDHYVAIRKPDRYDSLMTPMRSICWLVLIWVAAFSFCCPPLFGESSARYYSEAFICIIDWNLQKAYIITSGVLIITPPTVALAGANLYIFTKAYREKRNVYEKSTDSNSRPEHYFVNMLIGVVFFLTWLPWCSLQLNEVLQDDHQVASSPRMHFYLLWFAIANSFWKFIIYSLFDHDFRIGLKIIYLRIICSQWV